MFDLRRRQVLTLLGGTAAAWPLAARAQQAERVRRIGVLMNLSADDPDSQARIGAFLQGLQQHGWSIGGNLRIDYRWNVGDVERFRRYAAELIAAAPDVIVTVAGAALTAVQQATRTVRSYSWAPSTPSELAWWRAWRGRAATRPDSRSTSSA
jgi:putative tryptophan/tyrosine transport system substrate-binding protein